MLNLHPEWRNILRKAWSIRLIAATGLFSVTEAVLPLFTDNPPVSRPVMTTLVAISALGAFVTRILHQGIDE